MEVKSIKGYYVWASTDERSAGRVKGPFSDYNIASIECEKAGWYDSAGKVKEAWFMQMEDGRLFEYDPSQNLKFVDIEREYKKEMEDKIKSKLTKEELEFLNLK